MEGAFVRIFGNVEVDLVPVSNRVGASDSKVVAANIPISVGQMSLLAERGVMGLTLFLDIFFELEVIRKFEQVLGVLGSFFGREGGREGGRHRACNI